MVNANGDLKKQNYDDQLLLRAPKTTSILHQGSPEELEIKGYSRSKWKTFFTWVGIVLTLGILRLVLHWWRHWLLVATHSAVALENAQKLLIRQNFQGNHTIFYVKTVVTLDWMHFKNDPTVNEQDFHISTHFSGGVFRKTKSIRMFKCKQLRYVWNDETGEFQPLKGLDNSVSNVYLHKTNGLTRSEEFARRATYGLNEITIPYKSAFVLLATEALNPFYVFQIFSVVLWFLYDYYYYASVIIGMSIFGIFMSIRQTKKNQDALMKTVYSNDHAIVLHENGETELTETRYLVPGDIIEIPVHGCTMQCDAVLLSGNCIVDEALLTGESVPVTKTLLPLKRGVQFDMKEHGRHVLFSGTKVLQTRYIGSEKVLARVISIGDTTAKGSLIRSILYPPPVDYKFEQDSYKFIALLAAIAGIGFTYSLTQKILNKIDPIKLAVESLDLITIVVPPALPAAMTVGRFYAQKRLEKGNIFCVSPRSINVAGSIDLVCFDKTGTLTEEGLDMWGIVIRECFEHPIKEISKLPRDHFLYAMACCHSITVINGERKGDPLDLKMFEATEWELEDVGVPDEKMFDVLYPVIVKPKDSTEKATPSTTLSSSLDDLLSSLPDNPSIGIVREFPFESSLQRMSVITRSLSASHFTVYSKGSPEIIHALSHPESLPRDYYEKLDIYARKGLRVIALAYKPLDKKLTYAKLQKVPRDQIECDLTFLGFVILENRLKPETSEIIRELTAANIRSVMVTGDNILTAVSVARDCGILCRSENVITVTTRQKEIFYTTTPSTDQLGSFSSLDTCLTTTESYKGLESGLDGAIGPKYKFAVEGKTWQVIRDIYPDILPKIVARGAVFARMSPDQKQELIVELQALGHYVAMCGDGANDCGALKAAHAGISLSQAESSVASPFTSHEPTIGCVPKVVKEGRCALVTSFGIFKFMAAYSLVCKYIFTTQIILILVFRFNLYL
ncbi:hypothetical protein ACFFRR_009558 [Megaselia abdita]